MGDKKIRNRNFGIHLSGPNTPKTVVVLLSGVSDHRPFKIEVVYEKIGSHGMIFSDDRLFQIFQNEPNVDQAVIDCPLTVPPCVACTRQVCPGVSFCEDMQVAYMLALASRLPSKKKRRRSINPQNQRVVDIFRMVSDESVEPTYSANLAPLVVRALTLQRRLNSLVKPVSLKETSVNQALHRMTCNLDRDWEKVMKYRSFSQGHEVRIDFLYALNQRGWVDFSTYPHFLHDGMSVEIFAAFICSLVGCFIAAGKCEGPPETLDSNAGWVFLPDEQLLFY